MKVKSRKAKFVLLAAISLDGRITAGSREGSEWTSKEDKKFFQAELNKTDVVIMGRKTFEAIKRPLTPRNRIVFTHANLPSFPRRGTRGGSIPLNKGGARICEGGGCLTSFSGSSKKLITLLKENDWTRIAVVGGTSIYSWFLGNGLINEMYLTLEPVLFGSGKLLSERGFPSTKEFLLHSVKKLNAKGTLLLHYKNNKKV